VAYRHPFIFINNHPMKTMVLTGVRQMQLIETPEPRIIRADDVKIKMKVIGVCGSDIHYFVNGRIGNQLVKYPFPVGHEGAGEVVEVGAAVTRVKIGDRIAIEPAMPCWQCDQCDAGRPHTCRNLKFLGCPGQADGCMSEYIVMPETSCFPVSDQMTLDEAALSEPLAIGVYAVKQSIPMNGAKVGILGFGPIGMSVMLPAIAGGAAQVYVSDKIEGRIARATQNGAAWAGNPDQEDIVAAILQREPAGLDVVFECCGQQSAMDQAVDLLKPGGKIMIVGIPETDRWSFSVDKLRHKEITISNVRRQNHSLEDTLKMLEEHQVNVAPMVTHRFSLSESKAAFELVAGYRDGVMKAMIEI
jgi:L-iditol 2-dehydrogenase